jgi:hypothetical protein
VPQMCGYRMLIDERTHLLAHCMQSHRELHPYIHCGRYPPLPLWEMDCRDIFPTSPDPVLTTPSQCVWHQRPGCPDHAGDLCAASALHARVIFL